MATNSWFFYVVSIGGAAAISSGRCVDDAATANRLAKRRLSEPQPPNFFFVFGHIGVYNLRFAVFLATLTLLLADSLLHTTLFSPN